MHEQPVDSSARRASRAPASRRPSPSATWMCTPTPRSAASPAAASSVSSRAREARRARRPCPRPPVAQEPLVLGQPAPWRRRRRGGRSRRRRTRTRTPTSAHASAITSRLPSIAFGRLVVVDDRGRAALERLERAEHGRPARSSRGRGRRRGATRPARGSRGTSSACAAARACPAPAPSRGGGGAQTRPGCASARHSSVSRADGAVAAHRQRGAPLAVEVVQRGGDRAGGGHEADLADALDAVRRVAAAATRRGSPRSAARPWPAGCRGSRSVMLRRAAGLGVGREVLGERVAEAHVHRALDLALAQQRVDRPADVVRGDDPLDRRRSRGRSRRAARRSRTSEWMTGCSTPGRRASSSSRRGTRPRSRRRAGSRRPGPPRTPPSPRRRPSACRGCRWSGRRRARGWCRRSPRCGRDRRPAPRPPPAGPRCARPGPSRSSSGAPRRCRPSANRTTARAISLKPLPRPEFFSPRPRPTALPGGDGGVVVRA